MVSTPLLASVWILLVASQEPSSTMNVYIRAISLDMTKSLAVIALLCLGGSWQRASVGFVTCLYKLERTRDALKNHLAVCLGSS